jgi:hypothetical protein
MDTATSHKGKKILSYDFAFKLKVVNYAKEHGNHKAADHFSVDRKKVREWRKIEDSLRENAQTMGIIWRRKEK